MSKPDRCDVCLLSCSPHFYNHKVPKSYRFCNKKSFKPKSAFESKRVCKIKSGNFMFLSTCVVFIFLTLWNFFIQTNINNRNLLMSPYNPLHISRHDRVQCTRNHCLKKSRLTSTKKRSDAATGCVGKPDNFQTFLVFSFSYQLKHADGRIVARFYVLTGITVKY